MQTIFKMKIPPRCYLTVTLYVGLLFSLLNNCTAQLITTVARNGKYGYIGDSGTATSASLNSPVGVFRDGSGNLYVAEAGNNRIPKILFGNPSSPSITSFTPSNTCPNMSTPLFIIGTNFTGATTVNVGGTAVDSFRINNATSITAFVSNGNNGKITVTTPSGSITSDSTFAFDKGFTAFAYVASSNNLINVFNGVTKTLVATANVGKGASSINASPDGKRIYVSNTRDGTISIINTTSNTVIANLYIGTQLTRSCFSPDGSKLYQCSYSKRGLDVGGSVYVINAVTNAIITNIPCGNGTYGVCVSPDGKLLYATNSYDRTITIINTTTNKVIKSVSIGFAAIYVAISKDGAQLYLPNSANNTVSVFNTLTNTITSSINVDDNPDILLVSNDGSKLYVNNAAGSTINVINTATNTISRTIQVGNNPSGLSFSPDGKELFVSNNLDSTISIINTATNQVTSTIKMNGNPIAWGNFVANVPACGTPPSPPNITSFSPDSACAGATVTIKGSGFWDATSVAFGNDTAKSYVVVDDATITAFVDSGATGAVTVTTRFGTGSLGRFTYLSPTSSTTTITLCHGNSYIFNGVAYNKSGTYSTHLTNAVGCDSTASLILKEGAATTSTTKARMCKDSSFSFNGNIYKGAGTYTIHLLNSAGCDSVLTLILSMDTLYTLYPIGGTFSVCSGDSILLNELTQNGKWSSSNNSIATVDSLGWVKGMIAGITNINYSVQSGCGNKSTSQSFNVLGIKPSSVVHTPKDAACFNENSGAINVSSVRGVKEESPYQFSIDKVNWYNIPYTIHNLYTGNYSIYISNNQGCLVDSIPQKINYDNDASCDTLYVPTAFVPTSKLPNGFNRTLRPFGGETTVLTLTFRVFNRYGKLIFETHELNAGWDGTINGILQDTGTYIWTLDYTQANNKKWFKNGTSVLIR